LAVCCQINNINNKSNHSIKPEQLNIHIQGFVQGLGFRPFVFRLAKRHRLQGWVSNCNEGIEIVITGEPIQQQLFVNDLHTQLPPFAEIKSLQIVRQPVSTFKSFQISPSLTSGAVSLFVLPDIAPCRECITEINNPDSRYYRHPFTSCCYCGPRYSIMQSQPYDRQRTSMATFTPCADCLQEYRMPDSRRFYAQTIACPNCGPQIKLLSDNGQYIASGEQALSQTIQQLQDGKIVAIKGIGGYQLVVDATNEKAVRRLRDKKQRPKKPLAVIVKNLSTAKQLCIIHELEQQALTSPSAPIVLLQRLRSNVITNAVAPDNQHWGIMLPASPLHYLLCQDFDNPLVVTSGNRKNEPLCIDNLQAIEKLAGIADCFLTHDRPIVRPLDDSVVRIIAGKITLLRKARGYTPLPLTIDSQLPDTLAVGGYLKNTVAIATNNHIISSQHHGDLDATETQQQFESSISDLQQFYAISPTVIAHDLHPDYSCSQFVQQQSIAKLPVQHHYAHILSCMAEHNLHPPLLGIAWDGAGLGTDNTIWGSEALLITDKGFQRFAHLQPFPLPGADKAAREPRRSALGLLYEIYGSALFERRDLILLQAFSQQELNLLKQALNKHINCPKTSSMGRFFDAIASLLDLCHLNEFEGQAAMLLEQTACLADTEQYYRYTLTDTAPIIINWQVIITQIIDDLQKTDRFHIAAKFHNTLSEIIVKIAQRAGQQSLALSGGCFQNAYLTEKTVAKSKSAGFNVYTHEKIPPNDGGLAIGQAYAATSYFARLRMLNL